MKVLITGAAGFIGYHTCQKLLSLGYDVVGLDNINDYYPVTLKNDRLKNLGVDSDFIRYNQPTQSTQFEKFKFVRLDILDEHHLMELFRTESFDYVIHLAAQAGVRYSLDNPGAYFDANIKGFLNILVAVRTYPIKHLVYASSSSVYGQSTEQPFSVSQRVDKPISLYAMTKKANELMAYTYSHLYNISTTGLRFFTVYGPWGRPDMAPMLFAKAMIDGEGIKVFNHGNLERDFTYIDDIVNGVYKTMEAVPNLNDDGIRYNIFNIGNSKPVKLLDFITTLEEKFNIKANKILLPMQDGDVLSTYADVTELVEATGYTPSTNLDEGIQKFADWYSNYYRINA